MNRCPNVNSSIIDALLLHFCCRVSFSEAKSSRVIVSGCSFESRQCARSAGFAFVSDVIPKMIAKSLRLILYLRGRTGDDVLRVISVVKFSYSTV